MQHIDQLIHAQYVIPVEPAGSVLAVHSIAIDQGRIAAIVPTAEARQRFTAAREIDCRQHTVIPGLINTHTHAAMSLFRGMADDRPLQTWLKEHIWPAEARFVDRAFVRDGTRLAAYEMLRGGVTCFNDMYFFPDEVAAVATEFGIRAMVGMIVIGFPTAWAQDTRGYLQKGQEVHDHYRGHPIIHTAFAPHAPYTVDDAALRQIATLAEELDVPIHIHLHETAHEVESAFAETGERPLARLARLGLCSDRLLAVHMTQLSTAEIEQVARSGISVAHCPESNLKLASGLCPVGALIAAGANCALGTDGAASNNDLDLLSEMRTAALLAKAVANDPCAVPAATALQMATLNGARALGLEHEIGSLKAGKQADLVALDLSDPRLHPLYDPISQLVYATQREAVTDVWVAGRHVVQRGVVAGIDVEQLRSTTIRWRDLIAGSDSPRVDP
ncbi:MAG: TRZ/ATZ family hydrolase [Gammaproteobacteria bacterium]|nr:TRZ/ATZ family hydrolase [Gammaproteobacteria bacterium]